MKILDYDKFHPIRIVGIILTAVSSLGIPVLIVCLINQAYVDNIAVFIIVMTIWHLFIGIGILWQRMWGYYLLKVYLYILLPAVPIGTYISLKGLGYIRDNYIKDFFRKETIDL